ncbi:MAG: 2-C-methyl-D-erythritol 4-phosphate cytidylyltransferase [Bacteroidales bacterium]|nr:2-C-methyl-D-erythritol 4-phosphate cytidylyltransferase [Bacteroidales bacterium]
MEKFLIIVAGGKGKRMNSEVPKQFHIIAGKPVLMHTIERFSAYPDPISILLVLPKPFIDFWKSLCKRYNFTIAHQVVEGGDSRFQSVKNGLAEIHDDCLAIIHDGVRPLPNNTTLHNVFKKAEKTGNAVPAVKINESMRKISGNDSKPVNRKEYRVIQTPQAFHGKLIREAYGRNFEDHFTDDATVVESLGVKINLVEGNFENIKITRPVDLTFAEAFLK